MIAAILVLLGRAWFGDSSTSAPKAWGGNFVSDWLPARRIIAEAMRIARAGVAGRT